MGKTNKNKWFISLMVLIGMMIGMAISYSTEIIIFNRFETEKINNAENNFTYEDLQRYAKGSNQMGE